MLLLCNTMQEFIKWFLDNLNLIIIVGSGVIEFILLLIFKRIKYIDNSLVAQICALIEVAESKYKLGCDKKAFVLDECQKMLGEAFDYKQVSYYIEKLLSLPQKKEKSNV